MASTSEVNGEAPKLAKWMRQRRFIIKEIIGSEKKYIDFMNVLVDVFDRPSATEMKGDIHKAIFRDIDFIKNLNQKLLGDLQSAYDQFPYEEKHKMAVGQIIIRFAPFLNLYMDYYTGHDQALTTIKQLRQDRHHVTKVWEAGAADPRCNGQTIEFLLIMPIQRIPRYVLLLKSLIKQTPEEEMPDERAQCEKALEQVKAVAMKMDHAVEARQATLALLEVKREFKPELEFLNVEDDRVLILRDYVQLMDTSKDRLAKGEHLAVLFSDMLVIGRKMRNGTHSMEEHLAPMAANGDPVGQVIRIAGEPCTADMNSTVQLSFYERSEQDYSNWLSKLKEVCRNFKGRLPTEGDPALLGGRGLLRRSASGPLGHEIAKFNKSTGQGKGIHPALRRVGGSMRSIRRAMSLDKDEMALPSLDTSVDHPPTDTNSVAVWERDEDVHSCRVCDVGFNMLHRRHHCRVCGRIVCAKCSKYRVSASDAGIHTPHPKVRACADCFEKMCESSDEDKDVDPAPESVRGDEGDHAGGNLEVGDLNKAPAAQDKQMSTVDGKPTPVLEPVSILNNEAPPPPPVRQDMPSPKLITVADEDADVAQSDSKNEDCAAADSDLEALDMSDLMLPPIDLSEITSPSPTNESSVEGVEVRCTCVRCV